jgi:hypothetical protein
MHLPWSKVGVVADNVDSMDMVEQIADLKCICFKECLGNYLFLDNFMCRLFKVKYFIIRHLTLFVGTSDQVPETKQQNQDD